MNTATSLLITAALTVVAFAITRPLVDLEPDRVVNAVPAAFAVILIALFVMIDAAPRGVAGGGIPDAGQRDRRVRVPADRRCAVDRRARRSLDVLFAVLVIGVLTGRLRRAFGGADLDRLQELRD